MENQQQPQPQPQQQTQPQVQAEPQCDYIGQGVQIGTGFGGMKPVAQQGVITIASGIIALYNDRQELIDQATLAEVTVKPIKWLFGATAMLHLADRRYSIAIGHGDFMTGPVSFAPTAALGATSQQNKEFVKVFNALSGK